MKKIVVFVGILAFILILLGAYYGNIYNGIASVLYLPVTLILDVPVLLLPFTLIIVAGLSLYSLITKNYQKFYLWYKNLFLFIIFGISCYEIENLFQTTSYFLLPEFIILFISFLAFLLSIPYVMFVDSKKDTRYYLVANGFIFIYLIVKFIHFLG